MHKSVRVWNDIDLCEVDKLQVEDIFIFILV